jgi:ATP-dependent RNA helicase UAP56/SUB2
MGKTAVFVLSILQTISDDPKTCSAMILCHTRELAHQIRTEIIRFTKFMKNIRTEVIYGGEPMDGQIKMLKGLNAPHVVVGTPGRILALSRGNHIPMQNMKIFVLDECDKLLDQLGMRRDIQEIFKDTPHNKQVMMFTATLSNDIKDTCRKFMRNPTEVLIENESKLTLHGLKQYYVELKANEKIKKLIDLIDALDFNQVIIFVKSVAYAIKLAEILNKNTIPSKSIHRGIPQEER